MPHQVGVTAVAPVLPAREEELRQLLADIGGDPTANPRLGFGAIEGVHYARLFLLEQATDLQGRPLPAELVFMADFDAPSAPRLRLLVSSSLAAWSAMLSCCEGFGPDDAGTARVLAYLKGHRVRDAAYYVNTVGLSLRQVLAEDRLYVAAQSRLDREPELRDKSIAQIHADFKDWLSESPDLSWALSPPEPPRLSWRLGELVHAVAVPLLGLILLPVAVVLLPFWLIALRRHEGSDVAPLVRPSAAHRAALEALEDYGPVNQFTAVGFIKPGLFRAFTARAVLFLIAYGVRHIYNRGSLAGVKTIHFARWTYIDGGRRVIFASNYDGSVENYNDDFIDKVAWGLNAVFSNGAGYPPTRWLLWGGARQEEAFKQYLRVHQVPTQVWYAGYRTLTAVNITNNASIRQGFGRQDGRERWLRRL